MSEGLPLFLRPCVPIHIDFTIQCDNCTWACGGRLQKKYNSNGYSATVCRRVIIKTVPANFSELKEYGKEE